ncbi:MAG: peptidoglycan DD-metalloendopeptidase family protein [Legionellales bacterium]|nr:peptidoglycan DD-metalloendopeptidase family protein [Legionellales bacterium]
MDIEELNNTQNWKKFLQSPKRIGFLVLSIVIVVAGLVLHEINNTEETTHVEQVQDISLDQPVEQSNDEPIAVIEETPTPPTWQSIQLPKNTSLTTLLRNTNISEDDILAVEALPEVKTSSRKLKTGENIQILHDNQNKLYGLRYSFGTNETLNVTRDDQQFSANIVTQPIITKEVVQHGSINGSFMQSAEKAGIPRKIILELASVFAWKINFNKDLHKGDTFSVIYNNEYVNSKKIDTGGLIAAELNLAGTTYEAFRFTNSEGNTAYYSPEGQSLKTGFLRAPVHFMRVSSPFSPSRMQPLLHFRRPHLGVDLAAPRGTPIDAAGDGTISFVGRDAGYGNLVIIDHGHGITTRYGHIQRFVRGIYTGMHVKEGQIIAYVGSTGLATGPHLHYEFRINGIAHDPLKVKLPGGSPIPSSYKRQFLRDEHRLVTLLEKTDGGTGGVEG